MNAGRYCRDVESYLCRKNEGHLIRIVGPAFEMVSDWAGREIPLRVVYAGIDRTVSRRDAKGGRRRPVRIEFCEADVLDQFDEWRRAVGMRSDGVTVEARPTRSLRVHVAQVIDRLATWQAEGTGPALLGHEVARVQRELEQLESTARTARGEARRQLVTRLAEMERHLTATAHTLIDSATGERLRAEAARDLQPFRDRMPPDVFRQSVASGTDRLLYEHVKLPRIAYDR